MNDVSGTTRTGGCVIDLAQLREALHHIGISDPAHRIVADAAQELLTIREAGALIITPDKNGKWPGWALEAVDPLEVFIAPDGERGIRVRAFTDVLDALRDAMPDGSQ